MKTEIDIVSCFLCVLLAVVVIGEIIGAREMDRELDRLLQSAEVNEYF